MTDREKLIDLLESAESAIWWSSSDETFINKIADHLIANGVVISKNETTTQRWIPVTERLPGTEKVLITNGDIVMRGYRRPDGVWKYGVELEKVWEKISLLPVTHWMPLPEAPKEETT